MSRAAPSAARLHAECQQLELDFVHALECLRKVKEDPSKFKTDPSIRLDRKLETRVSMIQNEFLKIFEEIEKNFRSTSDDEFIDDASELSVTTSDSEPEYVTSSDESSEDTEYCSDDDDYIEILQ